MLDKSYIYNEDVFRFNCNQKFIKLLEYEKFRI